jgi:hypothetical protein
MMMCLSKSQEDYIITMCLSKSHDDDVSVEITRRLYHDVSVEIT